MCAMTQQELENTIETRVLQGDVFLLDDLGVGDQVMKTLAAEHAVRSVTLAKAIEPTMGRALLLTMAGMLLSAAKSIDAQTFQEPKLVDVHG